MTDGPQTPEAASNATYYLGTYLHTTQVGSKDTRTGCERNFFFNSMLDYEGDNLDL